MTRKTALLAGVLIATWLSGCNCGGRLRDVLDPPDGGQGPSVDAGPSGDAGEVDGGSNDAGTLPDGGTPSPYFTVKFGGNGYERISSVARLPDDSYVLVGVTESFGYGGSEAMIARFSGTGDRLWTKTLGNVNTNSFSAVSVVPGTSDVLAVGHTFPPGNDNRLLAARFTADGALVWQKFYGGSSVDIAHSLIATSDGNFLVGAFTQSYGQNPGGAGNSGDLWAIKMDGDGNILWQKTYGSTTYDSGTRVVESGGAYYLLGNTFAFTSTHDNWLIKIDTSGNLLWQKSYGVNTFEVAYGFAPTPEGGVLIAGQVGDQDPTVDLYAMKIAPDGAITWQNRYAFKVVSYLQSARAAPGGGYVLFADAFEDNFGGWLMKLDEAGEITWQRTFGQYRGDWLIGGLPEADAIVVFGQVSIPDPGSQLAFTTDVWFGRLHVDGLPEGTCPGYFGVSASGYSTPGIAVTGDTNGVVLDTTDVATAADLQVLSVSPPLAEVCN